MSSPHAWPLAAWTFACSAWAVVVAKTHRAKCTEQPETPKNARFTCRVLMPLWALSGGCNPICAPPRPGGGFLQALRLDFGLLGPSRASGPSVLEGV